METIRIGICYQPLEVLGPAITNGAKEEDAIAIKHWVLVFSPPSQEFAFTFEAAPGADERKTICTPVNYHTGTYKAFPLGTYYGEWDDLLDVLRIHPQRGSEYSSCFNNCQHFVAIFLLFLQAFAKSTLERKINIDEPTRYTKLRAVLRTAGEGRVWNEPNIAVGAMLFMPIPLGGIAGAGAAIAAEATVTSTVSAGGLAGWFGMTTTVIAPAAYASFAAVCAPIALGLTGVAGAAYILNKSNWRKNTMFRNPSIYGFPIRNALPLSVQECSSPKASSSDKKALSIGSSARVSAPILLASYTDTVIPTSIRLSGASSLYEVARGSISRPEATDSRSVDPGSFFMFYDRN